MSRPLVALRSAFLCALVCTVACGSSPPAVQPSEPPPLPPASGTPIGFLLDSASALTLRDDQVTRLKAIDDELAGQLADHPATSAAPAGANGPRHRGRRGGGASAGGGGGFRGGGRGGRGGGGGGGPGAGSAARPAPVAAQASEDRATEVRDALARAFTILDPAQRPIATQILADHGIDLDAGRAARPGAPRGEPDETSEPGEPDPGAGSAN